MGSALLLHHVLADQWVVVIIILIFSTKENMFVEHTENMMMDIFGSFMLWPEVIIPKIATLSKGPEPRPSCIIFCFTSHPCASCYHHFCLHQWVPPLDDVIFESSLPCGVFPQVRGCLFLVGAFSVISSFSGGTQWCRQKWWWHDAQGWLEK